MVIKVSQVQHYYPDISQRNLRAIVHSLEKRGKRPKWVIGERGKKGLMLDTALFDRHLSLHVELKNYCTDKLYWIFRSLGMNDNQMAKLFKERSKYFKDTNSWHGFFAYRMFNRADDNGYVGFYQPTMHSEFLRIGTKYIYLLNKAGKFEVKDREIFG